jgi:TRAP transporter TAXI family solute receptor
MINKNRRQHGIRCSVKSTGGSVYNLNAIRAGALDMGMAQSDWQYYAYQGTNLFASQGANPKLRAVFSVHSEPFTLIARTDSDINKLQDLKGKRVNVGARGSGQRGTIDILMKALKWTLTDFKLASELPTSEQVNALCNNKLDAIIVTVGHPSSLVKQASETCDAKVVAVADPAVEQLVAKNPYYRIATIPGGLYKNNPIDLQTFGVGATFVTSTDLADQTVYNIVKSVFENLDTFKTLHPAFAYLKPQEMVQDALSAPIHSGANRYYQEAGIACYQTTPSVQNANCESQDTDNDDAQDTQTFVSEEDNDTKSDLDPPLPK